LATPLKRIVARMGVGANSFGKDSVILPEGITQEILKEKLILALAQGTRPQSKVIQSTPIYGSALNEVDSTAQKAHPTSSLSAAVIFTVKDTSEKSWWGKLISTFTK